MRINGLKGSSSRVFLAILYTSILWFILDVMILALYSSLTEEGNGSTLKLPTNAEHQRNARDQEPAAYALSGEAGLDELQHDVLRHALKLRADANRTLSAGRNAKRKPSRFSWGNNLRETLLHSNNSKDNKQLNKAIAVGNSAVDKRLLEDRGEMKKEIEMLKKELNEFRGKYGENNEQNKLQFQDKKLRQNDKRYSDTGQRIDKSRIDNVQMVQMENEREEEEDEDEEEGRERQRQETNGAKNNELAHPATPGTHLVRDIDVTSQPRDPNGPGENGAMVRTRPEDQNKVKIGWDHAYFNEYVSDMISVERSVPDVRHKWCKTKEYSNDLPRTSVIICFTEESWSTLLRTVHSVLNRSPPELITEVLLIDDFSQREYLKEPLDEYMEKFPKVKIVRLSKREGLIRARLIGAEMAQGPVLTFLDSHVECNVGWLEPLLQRIHDDKTNVVCPSIDSIDATSFQYVGSGATIIGAFSWEMKFTWNAIPDYEARRRDDETWPIRSPAMAGGLFSIDKEFFYRLGTYDPGFDIWGAENLELSFKIWMCGGSLEIIPCSRVAHIFRKQQPYKFPDGNMKTFMRNTMRLVAVWVDEPYREVFYSLRPQLMGQEYGDVSDRIKLRQDLQCHDFQWYLDNVYPALKVPDTKVRARGEVRNVASLKCLDSMGKGILGVFPCHGEGNNQAFSLSWTDVLQHKNKCLTKTKIPGQLVMLGCSLASTAKIIHTRGQTIQDASTGKCLDLNADRTMAVFNHCDGSNAQRWTFTRYFDRTGKALPN